MVGTLVDANVLLDVLTEDATWFDWSAGASVDASESGPLWINPVIYAEVSVRFSRIEDLEAALPRLDYRRAALPWEAVFLAGRPTCPIAGREALVVRPFPTSSSAPTPPLPTSRS